jgi:hypothetical protein
MKTTDQLWKEIVTEAKRESTNRDKARAREGKMYASEFARSKGVTPKSFRHRMRKSGHKRVINTKLVPIAELEAVWKKVYEGGGK